MYRSTPRSSSANAGSQKMARISSGSGWRACTPMTSGPIEPANKTSRAAGSPANAQRSYGAGDQAFAGGGIARFAGYFYPAAVEALEFIAQAKRFELEAIGAKGVGLDNLRAGFDVGLVHAEDRFRLGGVQFIEAALRSYRFVQQLTHRTIGDENRIFQPLVEILNFQSWGVLCIDLRG